MQVSFLSYRNKPGMIYHTIHTPMPAYDYCTSKTYLNKRKHGGKVPCKYTRKVCVGTNIWVWMHCSKGFEKVHMHIMCNRKDT